MCPQRARFQSPRAAAAQDAEAENNNTTAQYPIRSKPSCPLGFNRHIPLKKAEGLRSDSPAMKLIRVPTRKKMMSAVIPNGRADVLVIYFEKSIVSAAATLDMFRCSHNVIKINHRVKFSKNFKKT